MNIYRDPLQPDAYLYENMGNWFVITEKDINKTKFIADSLPKLEKADLVPAWLLKQVVEIECFFTEAWHGGTDSMDAADPRLAWLK